MNIFLLSFQSFIQFSNSSLLAIVSHSASCIILIILLVQLFRQKDKSHPFTPSLSLLIFFLIPIISTLTENIDSIFYYIFTNTTFSRILGCLAWMTACFKFHSFLLFIEKLTIKKHQIAWYHYVLYCVETILCLLLIAAYAYRITYDLKSIYLPYIYRTIFIFWIISIIPSVITIFQKLSDEKLPYLIKKQLKTLLACFLIPHLLSIVFEFSSHFFLGTAQIVALNNLSIILITASIYFCFKQIMQFRFLNLSNHVQTNQIIPTETTFKEAIEHINIASSQQEMLYVCQQFFATQLGVKQTDINLYLRSNNQPCDNLQQTTELFLSNTQPEFLISIEKLYKNKILVRHELEFDEFYTDNHSVHTFVNFLRSIECDIFLPIINNKKILGYITISKQNNNKLYNFDQQSKMIVFAQFLAPAIHLMLQQNLYSILQDSKTTKEALHEKTQEINQYKESIKQLLKDRVENHIGIIFYKGKHFSFKNQEAQTLLGINPNLESDHPTTATLINFAHQIEKYQTTQTMHISVHNGTKLILTGMPHAEVSSSILLIIRKPEATDLIKMHIDALKDISDRDYLLYLESTKTGQIINKLLPSSHDNFLQTKIKLLNSILQKSALLIETSQSDLDQIINLIHDLSEQTGLEILDLHTCPDGALTLFGINPLLTQIHQPSLLERYPQGTIVIKNIEHLDTLSQHKLVQLLRYGIFTPFKSEQRQISEVRIICTTTYSLNDLLQDKKIIPDLYEALKKQVLSIPSLITMDQTLLLCIIDEYMYQNLQEHGAKQVQALTYKEKEAIIAKRIPSLFELKQKVLTLMMLKAQDKLTITQEASSNIRFIDMTGPELQLAAQLGKHALKDIQLMKTLWKKLGSQTKIADLLGVNRSSVSRRCKDYNLL